MRILIADDHGLFRDGLRLVLTELDPALEILEASTFDEAITRASEPPGVDLVLLDLVMPGMTWNEGLTALKQRVGETPLVVLTAAEDRRLVADAVRLGASGFIPKTSSSKVMIGALRLVLSGGVYLPPALLEDGEVASLKAALPLGMNSAEAMADPAATAMNSPAAASLTPRQREVLGLLGQGKSNKEIARVLDLSEGTVKLHVTAILKALKVHNRTGAVVAAARLGFPTGGGPARAGGEPLP
ncbi:response regulator transcription factor [Roseospira marina]|uniref:Response regulator transcription factor n=1 Tax=Roseospira marina TaxID=140057 RepID=A0A5M6I9B7_9PROT|nr:response regulator transcription factor [Roseospira marina]KAA5604866.1 response regulator transcription factor [Roseospira marina]MBB4315200.1 DNA-binding NarL/FixJ family response regulator [Roseospira marina]MBB5088200.1 DNA-binding NarL/FixJ family response regulator [Roseospira marina]